MFFLFILPKIIINSSIILLLFSFGCLLYNLLNKNIPIQIDKKNIIRFSSTIFFVYFISNVTMIPIFLISEKYNFFEYFHSNLSVDIFLKTTHLLEIIATFFGLMFFYFSKYKFKITEIYNIFWGYAAFILVLSLFTQIINLYSQIQFFKFSYPTHDNLISQFSFISYEILYNLIKSLIMIGSIIVFASNYQIRKINPIFSISFATLFYFCVNYLVKYIYFLKNSPIISLVILIIIICTIPVLFLWIIDFHKSRD